MNTVNVSVAFALSGETICKLHITPDVTVLQLRERIQKKSGIPWFNQRLLYEGKELSRRDEELGDVLLRSPTNKPIDAAWKWYEIKLVVRQYERREMQAAWIIE